MTCIRVKHCLVTGEDGVWRGRVEVECAIWDAQEEEEKTWNSRQQKACWLITRPSFSDLINPSAIGVAFREGLKHWYTYPWIRSVQPRRSKVSINTSLGVDRLCANHFCRKAVPVAKNSIREITPADVGMASLCLNCFSIISCPRVCLWRDEFRVINIAELVQVLKDLYHVSSFPM